MLTETLTGAFATTELVGRTAELGQILSLIQDHEKHEAQIIFVTGQGGIGKTRLLTEIIEKCKKLPGVSTSEQLIDAYHLLLHAPIEFTQAIYESLILQDDTFTAYKRDLRVLQNLRLSGEAVEIESQIEQVLESFLRGLRRLLEKQRVVIALDTLERFAYGVGDELPEVAPVAEAWGWLVEQLSSLSNLVIVTAGRKEAEELFGKASHWTKISLGGFSLTESQTYFKAAAQTARQNKNERVARTLESLVLQEIEQAHELTGGRPILLALAADYVTNGGQLKPIFDEARVINGKTSQENFQEKILARFLNLVGDVGQILRQMSLMPKGLDAELLSKLMEITPEIAEAYLRELERFSFIKQRYDEHQKRKTYYLHDEFYAMLKLAAFSASPSGWNEKQIIYKQVIQAYEDRFKHIRGKLRDSYKSMQTGGENQIDWKELNRLISLRSEVLLALLYYRLRQDPPKGFRRWVRFDHEAVIGGDLSFSIQLQLELTTYVRERASEAETQKDGWDTALVRWALLLRPIKHAWATGKSQEVVLMAEETQKHDGEELEDSIKLAMLLVWKAYALAYWDTPSAHNEINVVINALENYSTQEDIRAWLRQMLLAYSYRIRGYCYRVQDRTEDAILNYRQASVLLREVDLKIEIATVNNDLGFALMLIGYSSDARSLAGNALELRSELGLGSQVAFSLNTIALIDLYESRYKEAIENATKALNIFRAVSSKRGIGMALVALAEATRRHSSDLPGATVQVRLDMLTRAYEYADEAYAIFHENGEVSRQVEALIEKGCARRDAVRLVQEAPMVSFSKERFIRESQNFLQQAGKLATTLVKAPQIHNRQIDALVNLAWLGFYAGEEAGEAIRQEAEDEVERLLTEYQLAEGSARPKIYGKPDYQPLLSTQLGKLHVLRGHRIYKNHEAPEEENNLWKARFEILEQASLEVQAVYRSLAQEYFLGLEHGALYSSEYRDLRLAKQQIFDHLKGLRSENLQLFMEYVTELETTYQIAMPPGSQLRQLLVNRALWMEDVKSM